MTGADKHHRFHYAWIVPATTFVVLLASAGVRATPTILIVPLEQEFHWSHVRGALCLLAAALALAIDDERRTARRQAADDLAGAGSAA